MWLLVQAVLDAMEHARSLGAEVTSEQREKFFALHGDAATGPSRILSIAGNKAEIHIEGVLTNVPNFFAQFFGGGNVTYGEIVAALAEAESTTAVDNIVLRIDSSGGTLDGLFEAIKAIQDTTKPIKALVSNTAASAAFALASHADEIVAENLMARFGSIGVVTEIAMRDDEVRIASSKAPLKVPDVTTAKGVEDVRKQLDAIHDVFVSMVADGRGVTDDKVNSDFGQGALLVASDALSRGMIDSISEDSLGKTTNEGTNAQSTLGEPGERVMNLNELRTEHPTLIAEAIEIGRLAEVDRVSAHMKMGIAYGAMDIAAKAITEGAPFSAALQADYMSAGRNADVLDDSAADDAATAAATDAATTATDTNAADAQAEAVLAKVQSNLGVVPAVTPSV